MNITLIGYMTAGKTTIGKLLSERLKVDFFDLDDLISQKTGIPVPQYLREKGELAFRKVERETLMESFSSRGVLASGGGTPCYYNNVEEMLESSFVVYLQWPMSTLIERVRTLRDTRPLLDGISDNDLPEYIAKHVFDRRPFYEKAHHIVFCGGMKTEDIISEIEEAWQAHSKTV